ncbi:hypothetical protein DMB38_06365 [Streptomyces sp. WAC 06738]|jgi:Flp pilus assembly protein TadB|uniref:hypothetical protein n=1 Tax=Streptomyces sp. WAC 06738 TaxID=2203210 RepID=UPI000F6D6B1D|nr:hypothetical protein [Streptomyces sp. WAC 06738]AZM45501.1 hypothetical protein DMB38_06365 [Streptomyces sp. WAC 06738]
MAGNQPGADDEPRLPDDIWERFQRDSLGQIEATAPKERSARWYEVTERLAAEEARREAAPKERRMRRPRPRMPHAPVPRALTVCLVLVSVVLVLSAAAAYLQYGRVF